MPTMPTLFVVGSAERDVTPDEVDVTLHIATPLHPSPQAALAHAAEMRARVDADMRARFADAAIADRRITVREETKRVEVATGAGRTEHHQEALGYTGHCALSMRAGADRAAELVAHGGMHADVESVHPAFHLSAALARATERELECAAVRDGLERAHELAAAAGHTVVGIMAIGEQPAAPEGDDYPGVLASHALAVDRSMDAGDVQDALSELRPAAQRREARMPVRVAIAPPEGGSGWRPFARTAP